MDTLYMTEVCAGSATSTRALIEFGKRVGLQVRAAILDLLTEAQIRAAYPGLIPYLDSGEIVHFQLHLGQASESDLGTIVEGLLGVRWEALDFVHIGFDCRTYSWAAVSKCQHRSSEGAAITILAQEYDKFCRCWLDWC